jgi:hypothetical protein
MRHYLIKTFLYDVIYYYIMVKALRSLLRENGIKIRRYSGRKYSGIVRNVSGDLNLEEGDKIIYDGHTFYGKILNNQVVLTYPIRGHPISVLRDLANVMELRTHLESNGTIYVEFPERTKALERIKGIVMGEGKNYSLDNYLVEVLGKK